MSRSRYYAGSRYDPGDRAEWYAWKRRREDVRTGRVRVRVYGGRAIKRAKKRNEETWYRWFFSGGPTREKPEQCPPGSTHPYSPGWNPD